MPRLASALVFLEIESSHDLILSSSNRWNWNLMSQIMQLSTDVRILAIPYARSTPPHVSHFVVQPSRTNVKL
jgi:hypothetical protein